MINVRCPMCGYPYLIEVFDSQTGEFIEYMCKQCHATFKEQKNEE